MSSAQETFIASCLVIRESYSIDQSRMSGGFCVKDVGELWERVGRGRPAVTTWEGVGWVSGDVCMCRGVGQVSGNCDYFLQVFFIADSNCAIIHINC